MRLTVLFAAISLCFVGASFNHFRDIWMRGFLPYQYASILFNAFWTSLAVVDLSVPTLFFLGRPRAAMITAMAIMLFDVVVNTIFAANYLGAIYRNNIDLIAQTAFLIFLLVTVPIAWRQLDRANDSDRTQR